jgi:agmatinase
MKTFFEFKEKCDENTEFIIFGIPWDSLSSLKSIDSALAPKSLREITFDLARTTELGFNITNFNACDMGDIKIDPSDTNKNIKNIDDFVKKVYLPDKPNKLVMIGGDHFCSFPVIKSIGDLIRQKNQLGILLFDAHLDFYDVWEGSKFSHTTVSHRIFNIDYINNKNLYIVGTRDIDNIERENAKAFNLKYLNAFEIDENGIEQTANKICDFFINLGHISKLYVSIDIDVLDPSIAPGTGYAIPGGLNYRDLWKILKILAAKFEIIAFDIVEVSPGLDLPNKITQTCAAKLIVEFMSFIKNKN